jgi:hypothetical protein
MAKSGCIYGSTGCYKTTAIAHFSRYIAETTGKATLLLSADGGGWTPCDEEIAVGMIRPYQLDISHDRFLSTLVVIGRGYWPRNPEDPDMNQHRFAPIDWSEIGGMAVEGFTSIGTGLLLHCSQKALKTGEDATSKFARDIMIEDERGAGQIVQVGFAGNSKAHYQFVHNQLQGFTKAITSQPFKYVLFTGIDKKAEDDDKTTIRGVHVPGKAITTLIPTWVGDFIHAQDYSIPKKVKVPPPGMSASQCKPDQLIETDVYEKVCRYYFKDHPDPTDGVLFKAKPRITHGAVMALSREYPGGYFEPTPDTGFDLYLKTLDRLLEKGVLKEDDSLKKWRERMDEKLGRKPIVATAK